MKLWTIGFTKRTARDFFTKLKASGATQLVDVRLNNVSQLAGFAKRNDLEYFVRELCGMKYVHLPQLAPTQDILDAYKKNGGDWAEYERKFITLMRTREIEKTVPREVVAGGCLLCSEHEPHQCHRRLVAEYLRDAWGDVDIGHIS